MSDIPSWAVKGAKVVCIADHPHEFAPEIAQRPTKGAVYTIRESRIRRGRWGLILCEISNPINPRTGTEWGYNGSRFRPLISRSQEDDVKLFQPLLVGKPRVGVDA